MGTELLEEKLKELQISSDSTLRKTYELIVFMVKNAKSDLNSKLPGSWELADILKIEQAQMTKLKTNANSVFRVQILIKEHGALNGFNPEYFLDLRKALRNCGEELPPLTFKQLVLSAAYGTNGGHFSPHFSLYSCSKEGGLFAVSTDEWKDRPLEWNLFEDVAPNNVEVLVYEQGPGGFFAKAIASKNGNQLDSIILRMQETAADHVNLKIEKALIEGTGRTLAQIRNVLTNENNRLQGYVSTIAHSLLKGYISEVFPDNPALALMKSQGWITEHNEVVPSNWFTVNSFVRLCYDQYISDEEKRAFQTAGLPENGIIEQYYGYKRNEHYDTSIIVPYTVSSSSVFPFRFGEEVRVRIKGDSLIIEKIPRHSRKRHS